MLLLTVVTLTILNITAISAVALNPFNYYYVPISQDPTRAENPDSHNMGTKEDAPKSSNHESSNSTNGVTLGYWTEFFGVGTFTGIAVIYHLIGHDINRMRLLRYSAAVLAITTGVTHVLLVQDHLKESLIFGVFFAVSGTALIAYGVVISRFDFRKFIAYYYLGIIGTVALIALYLFTRIVTVPLLPESEPESVSILDVIVQITEGLLLIVLIYMVRTTKSLQDKGSGHTTMSIGG